jgi:hypothetical protein
MAVLEHLEHPFGGHHGDGHDEPGKPKDKDHQHRDNMLIILGTFLVVIFSYLIYRGNKSAAAGGGPITSASMGSGSGTVLSPGGSANVGTGVSLQDLQALGQSLVDSQSSQYQGLVSQLQADNDAQQQAFSGFSTWIQQLTANLSDTNRPADPYIPPTAPVYTTQPIDTSWIAGINPLTGRQAVSGPAGEAAIGAGQLGSTPGVTKTAAGWLYQGQLLVSGQQQGVGTVYYLPGQNVNPGNVAALRNN